MIPREASLSDSYTSDRCCFSRLDRSHKYILSYLRETFECSMIVFTRETGKILFTRQTDKLASLGIMGPQLEAPLKSRIYHGIIVTIGLKEAPQLCLHYAERY